MNRANEHVGYACAYTPLPLIVAAGFVPYRLLPMTEAPDQAGRILHDNLCPHVKAILDRAMAGDHPPLAGMVLMNSCDAMRRLYDAWQTLPGRAPAVLIDLPVTADGSSISFFAGELRRLARTLEAWRGVELTPERVRGGIAGYNEVAELLSALAVRVDRGALADGPARLQEMVNQAATSRFGESLSGLRELLAEPERAPAEGVPLYLFGNVLPDPEAFRLFAACGARIAASDLCTGTRLFQPIAAGAGEEDPFEAIAAALLGRQPCARTFDPAHPLRLADDVLERARAAGSRGVLCHTIKFCDPYQARLAAVRRVLQEAGMPLLVLEGDCTLRSIGQQRTRVEAFVEMLR
ncbi:MAG: 2-hydroxyacyl-CoA dehydratase family protein [Deltaproteobacteria bacterium]|nr:2-hydroxyacyl-CoA dehydratase family protein [Deltaproteobacteria bacterium]